MRRRHALHMLVGTLGLALASLLACAGAAMPARAGELRLTYERVSTDVNASDTKAPPRVSQARDTITIGLGDRYFFLIDSAAFSLVDVARRRQLATTEGARTVVESPIFGVAAFHDAELENRLVQRNIWKSFGSAPPASSTSRPRWGSAPRFPRTSERNSFARAATTHSSGA